MAVLPLAMLLFGINETALRFVIVNATIWPIAIAVTTGFKTATRRSSRSGRNIGLSRVARDLGRACARGAPAHDLRGQDGWAFGWRTIIAAELVFGVAGQESGLGNYIDNARQYFLTPQLFAGLVTIALLGVVFETLFGVARASHRRPLGDEDLLTTKGV